MYPRFHVERMGPKFPEDGFGTQARAQEGFVSHGGFIGLIHDH